MKMDYISWKASLQLKKYPDNTITLEAIDNSLKSRQLSFSLNDTGAEIVQLIDGTRTFDEIVLLLSAKYNEDYDVTETKVQTFIQRLSELYSINLVSTESAINNPVSSSQERAMYPKVASIELTNKCNIKCLHCYGNFGNVQNIDMSIDDIKKLLLDLRNIGVQTVELTGGEITVHPYLKEILLYALELEFEQVSLLTNGINLSDEIINIIIENKSRIYMQIDVHSLDDNYLKWFTKASKTVERIKTNIIKLAVNNVKMRTATIITHKNIDEIEDIAEWVHSLKIEQFGVSPVISLGRAMGANEDIYLTPSDIVLLEEKLLLINSKYKNFLSLIDSGRSENKNCGSLTSHCVVSSLGEVKICTMDNLEYFNSSIGNIHEKDIKTLYDENADYVLAFYNMPSPQINSMECRDCSNKYYCSACVLRGFVKVKEIGDECLWFTNKVPALVKEKLSI